MNYLSICSGIEAASVAFEPLGWRALAFSEIEAFPCSVLEHRYPNVPNFGDMTKWRDWDWEILAEADMLVGGPPCQAFSVAGLRNGLEDERGQLTISYIHLLDHIDEIRKLYGKEPAICLYENVPGILNSKDNAFGAFLGGLAGEDCELLPSGGKWTDSGCVYGPKRSIAWRVLDAQYFGLAQRRKRVFVIASARDIDPSQILFEFESMRRDTPPSRETWKDVTRSVGRSSAFQDTYPINTMTCQGRPSDDVNPRMGLGIGQVDDPQNTLSKGHSHAVAYSILADVTPKIGGGGVVPPSVCTFGQTPFQAGDIHIEITPTMCVRDYKDPRAVAIAGSMIGRQDHNGPNGSGLYNEHSPTLTSSDRHGVASQMQVRRLTPIECERLQGFPDGWTDVPHRSKPSSDGPRYKALGNSMAVPVMRWIGERINNATA